MLEGKELSVFITAAAYWCVSAGSLTPYKFQHHKSRIDLLKSMRPNQPDFITDW